MSPRPHPAGCLLAAALAATPAARAESSLVTSFLESAYLGCMQIQGARIGDARKARVFCLCSGSKLRTDLESEELEQLAHRAANGVDIGELPQFQRIVEDRRACDAVGTHDGRASSLERERLFGPFSIALPEGFLLLGRSEKHARRNWAFHRFHADLETTTLLQITILADERIASSRTDDDVDRRNELELAKLVDELRQTRQGWRAGASREIALGNLALRTVEWSARERATPVRGIAGAGTAAGRVVLVRIQDDAARAEETLALARRSLETFRLR